jgi:signal peptidase I
MVRKSSDRYWRDAKRIWRKVWHFIWEDDSWASWFVNVIIAFIIIKFIVYPVLGLVLATSHPIVAVVSGSMEHDGSFDDWWASSAVCERPQCTQGLYYDELGISKEAFREFKFRNGFNKGDIMFLFRSKPENIEIGDVIVFKAGRADPIIHRVISVKSDGEDYVFMTKGDHNTASYYFEASITEDAYIGKAFLRLPYAGYIKLGFAWFLEKIGIGGVQ